MNKETVRDRLKATGTLEKFEAKNIENIRHNDSISKSMSSSAWTSAISLSGIMTTAFALICSFDSKTPHKIPEWFIIAFFLYYSIIKFFILIELLWYKKYARSISQIFY